MQPHPDPQASNEDAQRRASAALQYIAKFWEIFEQRPGMLGRPLDLEAMFFYLDRIEYLLRGGDPEAHHDVCWSQFLIEKKWIRGARPVLRESLAGNRDPEDFDTLQAVRREFLAWRAQHPGWQAMMVEIEQN